MNLAQVKEVITGVLSQRFAKDGYSSADVKVEEDFDGEEIIRVTIHLARPVENIDELYDSVGEIRARLQQEGDKRFVFLNQDFPGADDFDGEDEDISRGMH
ncbi:MAG: hypothetical protein HZC06_10615 [Methylocystis sp.]|nr:hypothetical protein [Methylocystis sp.]MBI5312951.1 hypothetical protein [Methylocystis sp.]